MRKTVLNYKIIIEKEKTAVYTVYCPALGLADWGKTIDQAMRRIRNLISFHIESLKQLQKGNHYTSVAVHSGNLPKGTLKAILKQTELLDDELREYLR